MSGCTGKSYAVHFGDILGLETYASVTGCTATTDSAAFAWDNQWGGCEQMRGDVYADGNSIDFLFTQNPASGSTSCTGSFERGSMRFRFDQENIAYQPFLAENGTYFTGSLWDVGGNGASAATGTATTSVYSVQGSSPAGSADGTGNASSMYDFTIFSCCEVEGGPVFPKTFLVDAGSGCFVYGLTGRLDFSAGAGDNFAQAGAGVVNGFNGFVDGDPSIVSTQPGPQGWGTYSTPVALAASGTVSPSASYVEVAPTAARTGIILGAGSADGQQVTVANLSAFLVTFAASGSNVATNSETIAAKTAGLFFWSANTSLWHRVKVS
jgi:hypothetical protein